jgi:hypothetical protein
MARVGRVAVACGAWVSLALCSQPALAARSRTVPTAAAATRLARLIRRDAGLESRRFRHAVTVTKRCCGVRVLHVHHRAKAAGSRNDTYVLTVETRRGVLESVVLSEHSSEERQGPRGTVVKISLDYLFAIVRLRSRRNAWIVSAVSGAIRSTTGGSGPQFGSGSSMGCGRPGPMPLALYERALRSLRRAKRHYPAAFADLAGSACETPHASAP